MKSGLILMIAISGAIITLAQVNAEEYKNNSLCLTKESIYFSCTLENKKTISLCGEKNNILRYKYGTQALIELGYPSSSHKMDNSFYRINASGGSVQMDIIKFKTGNYTYNLYDSFFDGIAVWGPHGLVLKKTCESNIQNNINADLLKRIPERPQQENNFN